MKIKQILCFQVNKGNQFKKLKYCYSKETYWNHIKKTTMQLNLVFGAVGFVGLRRNTYHKNILWHTNMKVKHESTKEVRVRKLVNQRKKKLHLSLKKKLSELITWPQDTHFRFFFHLIHIYCSKISSKMFQHKAFKNEGYSGKAHQTCNILPCKMANNET